MPTDAPANEAELVPKAEAGAAGYDTDFYTWTLEQARLIREGRWTAVDCDNVAEEIESLGREQFAKLESALRVLLVHMLKWDYQPERRGRSWQLSIKAQRIRVERVLSGNPSLRPRTAEPIEHAYRLARIEAAQETALDEQQYPERCPYAWDEIVLRDFAA